MKTTIVQDNITPIRAEMKASSAQVRGRVLFELRIGFVILAILEIALHVVR